MNYTNSISFTDLIQEKFINSIKAITGLVIIFLISHSNFLYSKDTVKIVGSTTVGPIAKSFAKYYETLNPNIKVEVLASGSGYGAKALINNTCQIALMSRFMKEKEFQQAVENGVIPVFHHVVRDGIAMVVNKKNPVQNLSLEQIRNIYNGKIRNWKELGGHDRKIIVITRCATSGTRDVFDDMITKIGDTTYNDYEVIGNKEIEDLVIRYDNAIGYVGLGFLEGVKVLMVNGIKPDFNTINDGMYPLTRPLFMVTNGYPQKDTPIYGIISMSRTAEGKKMIKQLGWFGSAKQPLSLLLKEFIFEYWQIALAVLLFILSLIAFSILASRWNIKLRKVVIKRDKEIIQRKKAEVALKESEENLKITLYSIGDAVISTDTNGMIQNMNPVAEQLTGWPLEEALNKSIENVFVIVNSITRKPAEDPIKKTMKSGRIVGLANHTVLISRNGNEYQIADSAAPVKDLSGNIKGVVLIFRDVTEDYEMHKLLRESEEKYRLFLENFQGIAYQSEYMTFQPLLFHGTVESITGYKAEDFIKGDILWSEIVHPNDMKFVLEERDNLRKIKEYVARDEYRIINKNGEIRWIFDIARCFNCEEDLAVIQGSIYDITNRKNAEAALKESEERFRGLVENSPTGIISINKYGEIIHINPKLLEIIGNSVKNEFQNINLFEKNLLFSEVFAESVMKCLQTAESLNFFDETITKFGKKLYLKYHLNPVIDMDKKVSIVIANIEDYTERKKAERELQRISKLESLGNLAGGIAHNFKNILAAISLNTEIIKLQPNSLNDGIIRIENSIKQAAALATRFQTFTKSAEPVKESIDITKVILEADSMALSGSNISSTSNFSENLNNVLVDPKQMNEVFMNLLINAKQATPKDSKLYYSAENITLDSHQIGNLSQGDYVLIKIMDHGIGIPKENLQYIFDPFFTTKEDGNGLGLSSVHFIIQKHDGHISVESEQNIGTTFKIYLPATKQRIDDTKFQIDSYKLGDNKKILLMDDDEEIRESLSVIGKVLQYNFIFTKNGEQAISEYKNALNNNHPFSAVILDLTNKCGMGGEETIKELVNIDPSVKAIVFSGYSEKPIMSKYHEYGFKAKLEKPITVHTLSETLHGLLQNDASIMNH